MKCCTDGSIVVRAVIVALLPMLASASLAQDGIDLTVRKGPGADDVTLEWMGGVSPWEVFSSTDPAEVGAPSSRLGESTVRTWFDSPPAADAIFYRIMNCGLPLNPDPHGCTSCGCCDPWPISWDAVSCATHYRVRWKCSIVPEQMWDAGNVTSADLCLDVGICYDDTCTFGVGYIRVEACNATGCSPPIDVPANEIPITCGGGCCC